MSIHNFRDPGTAETGWKGGPPHEAYIGCVLEEGEHNYHDDSDGYALVWDEEKGVIEVGTWTTRGCSDVYATVDATDEVRATVKAWKFERKVQSLMACSIEEAPMPGMHKQVVIVRGRKVPQGTKGEVVWAKIVNYDPWKRSFADELRVGIEDEKGIRHYTAARNCTVLNPESYHLNRQQAEERARYLSY